MAIVINIIVTYIGIGILFCISEQRYRNYILLRISCSSLRGIERDYMLDIAESYLQRIPYRQLRAFASLFFIPVLVPYIFIYHGKK